jgi:hypothetical protein
MRTNTRSLVLARVLSLGVANVLSDVSRISIVARVREGEVNFLFVA